MNKTIFFKYIYLCLSKIGQDRNKRQLSGLSRETNTGVT